tara:strand:- start:25 stop:588 length:564 start_codon:yes stop_codon:yes gene_type:complete
MAIIIGVTGRVGVGKTYLIEGLLNNESSYDVIDLDKLGHEVLKQESIKEALIKTFGNDILKKNHEVNRARLGDIVFNDLTQLRLLNNISHPAIKKLAEARIKTSKQNAIIIVGALIKEIGLLTRCNYIISIIADNKKREEMLGIKKRIDKYQQSDKQYKLMATHVFKNTFLKDIVEKFSILVQNLLR